MSPPACSSARTSWRSAWLGVLGGLVLCACDVEPEAPLVTRIEALTPAAPIAPPASAAHEPSRAEPLRAEPSRVEPSRIEPSRIEPSAAATAGARRVPVSDCPELERQARELRPTLPQQLDEDTRATGVTTQGCNLTLEYELSTLTASDVASGGVPAMRQRVVAQLCSDRGARAVLERGGSFTNVYYDRVHAPIGRFSVAGEDCE